MPDRRPGAVREPEPCGAVKTGRRCVMPVKEASHGIFVSQQPFAQPSPSGE